MPGFFDDSDRCGYLVLHHDVPVGFALVQGVEVEPRMIAEFFVVRAVRRQGIGHAIAAEVLRRYPSAWEIAPRTRGGMQSGGCYPSFTTFHLHGEMGAGRAHSC